MALRLGCSIIIMAVLMSGCIGDRSSQLFDKVYESNVKSEVEGAIKSTQFCAERGCKVVSCGEPLIIQGGYDLTCVARTTIGLSGKRYPVDVKIFNDKIVELKYNGTMIN